MGARILSYSATSRSAGAALTTFIQTYNIGGDIMRITPARVGLIRVLLWPAIVVMALVIFREPISIFIKNIKQANVSVGGDSVVTVSVTALDQSAQAVEAEIKQRSRGAVYRSNNPNEVELNIREGQTTLSNAAKGANLRRSLLWVDDNPDGNSKLIQAFGAVGISVTVARSTNEAKGLLNQRSFDLVITDASRGDDNSAGTALARYIRESSNVPIIIYARVWARENAKQEKRYNVNLITADPSEVYREAMSLLFTV